MLWLGKKQQVLQMQKLEWWFFSENEYRNKILFYCWLNLLELCISTGYNIQRWDRNHGGYIDKVGWWFQRWSSFECSWGTLLFRVDANLQFLFFVALYYFLLLIQTLQVSGKPIKLVGRGERMEDLEPFYPDRMAGRILGMGDVLSFVEKAQEIVSVVNFITPAKLPIVRGWAHIWWCTVCITLRQNQVRFWRILAWICLI